MEGRRPTSGPTVPRGLGDSEQDPPHSRRVRECLICPVAGGRVGGHGLGEMLKLNPLLPGMQKVCAPSGQWTLEGPGQMAQKVGVQRSQVGSQVVLTAKTTRRASLQSPNPLFCRW